MHSCQICQSHRGSLHMEFLCWRWAWHDSSQRIRTSGKSYNRRWTIVWIKSFDIKCLRIQILTKPSDLQVMMTCGSIISFMGLCFCIICLTSQILIDHSISIHVYMWVHSQWLSVRYHKKIKKFFFHADTIANGTDFRQKLRNFYNTW